MFNFRSGAFIKLHRIDEWIPKIHATIVGNSKRVKLNMKHDPACALNIKSEIKQEPMMLKHDPNCAKNMKFEVKQEPMMLKHDPECDLLKTHDFHLKPDDDTPRSSCHQEEMIKTEPDDREENSGIEKETVNSGKEIHKPTMFKRLLQTCGPYNITRNIYNTWCILLVN